MALPGDRMAVALGDVSGKGVAAALMMAKFSGDTRSCMLTENAPAPTATRLNGLLCAAGIEDKFITLGLCVLDAPARKLTLTSAGHTPVIIRRADGRAEEVGQEVSGLPLGIMEDSEYEQTEVQLDPGDVVVIYSDGVTDARAPAMSCTTRRATTASSSEWPRRPAGRPPSAGRSSRTSASSPPTTRRPTTSPWCAWGRRRDREG